MNKLWVLIVANVLLFDLNLMILTWRPSQETKIVPQTPIFVQPERPNLQPFAISNKTPGYLPYDKLFTQLQTWVKETPGLTEFFTYGNSSNSKALCGIRIGKSAQKKVLVTACIHGNEPLSTSVVMSYIGTLLAEYNKNPQITKVLNESEIWFVPVVSPDSYPSSRHVDGVDPNRNFPTLKDPNRKSVAPVAAIQQLFLKEKFDAVISGHTWGRVFLIPHGDTMERSTHDADFQRIIGKMCDLTRSGFTFYEASTESTEGLAPFSPKFDPINIANHYKYIRACEMYSQPIFGTEVDWYYRHGAFAVVMEFGTHQRIPSMEDTRYEFDMTWKAFLYFLEEAPKVEING